MQKPEEQNIPCPRCGSTDTKFSYFNNYNLNQPRHFCKTCGRYWTKGGALFNIPVGGGFRKGSKRRRQASSSSDSSTSERPKNSVSLPQPEPIYSHEDFLECNYGDCFMEMLEEMVFPLTPSPADVASSIDEERFE